MIAAMVFDLDTFIAECLAAAPDQAAVAEVVGRAVSEPGELEQTFTCKLSQSNLGILHYSEHLTVQHVVFPPAYRTGVHDHLTWAVIGTWGGYEDNHRFARDGDRAARTSVERCEPGQKRLEPINKRLAGGCHLTRHISEDIERAGFDISKIETYYFKGEPKPMGYTYEGRALKS